MSLPTLTLLRALEWFKKSRLSSENLYHADLGSQNDGNSSTRELLWEMNNNNNTSPDILCGVRWLFLVKTNVSTSMKQQNYLVYCHLDQLSGEVAFSKCNCKPGQGGCCKHVVALLYRLLDYKNLEPKEVPDVVSCTQVLKQWSIPIVVRQKWSSLKNWLLRKLIMLETNKRKCPLVQGKRENYCSTPPYAKKVLDFYVFIVLWKKVIIMLELPKVFCCIYLVYIAYFFMMVFHWFDWVIFLFFTFKLMK